MEKIINCLIATNFDKKVADVIACLDKDEQIIACKHLLGIESMIINAPKYSKPIADDSCELYGVGTLVRVNPLKNDVEYKCDYTSIRYVKTEADAVTYNSHKYVNSSYKESDEYPIKATREHKDSTFHCTVKGWCENAILEID